MAALKRPTLADCQVRPEHLENLQPIHDLLATLNDPLASRANLEALVEDIPTLASRCIRRAIDISGDLHGCTLARALSFIGNRGLEEELLALLEELTICKTDLEEQQEA